MWRSHDDDDDDLCCVNWNWNKGMVFIVCYGMGFELLSHL